MNTDRKNKLPKKAHLITSAADKRKMRWDELFQANDDIVLELKKPFDNSLQNLDEKICALYREHHPGSNPRLSEDKKKILTGNVQAKVGKFLEEHDWALYDDWNLAISTRSPDENKDNSKSTRNKNELTFDDIKNRRPVRADQINPQNLRVVISRDPHKIAEMSTEQRWHSCMAEDGIHFEKVYRDIQAGTLIAYLVHKDDTDVQFPLMRQLLKPYEKKTPEGGRPKNSPNIVLVPAKIYGGDGAGNMNSRELFSAVNMDFVKRNINANASGVFRLCEGLYLDGQEETVTLGKIANRGQINQQKIVDEMLEYILKTLMNLTGDLHAVEMLIQDANTDQDRERLTSQKDKYVTKLRQLLDPEKLARQYFPVMRKAHSISDVYPSPQQMKAAAHDGRIATTQRNITPLVLLMTGDHEKLKENLENLDRLVLYSQKLNDVQTKTLAKAIDGNKNLKEISLQSNEIGDEGIKALAEVLNRTNVTSLDVRSNHINSEGAQALAKCTEIQELDLVDNSIGPEGAEALANNTSISKLSLCGNRIADRGAKALAEKENLTELNLIANEITDNGLQSINKWASFNTLTKLNLSNNKISDKTAAALAENTSLTHLYLQNTDIGKNGRNALSEGLLNNKNIMLLNDDLGTYSTALKEHIKENNVKAKVLLNDLARGNSIDDNKKQEILSRRNAIRVRLHLAVDYDEDEKEYLTPKEIATARKALDEIEPSNKVSNVEHHGPFTVKDEQKSK